MIDQLLQAVVSEIAPVLTARALGKIFQLGRAVIAIDFRTGDGRYLLISAQPNRPRLYLIARQVRELEKESLPPSAFVLVLRKHLSRARLSSVTKDAGDRIVHFAFDVTDEVGNHTKPSIIAQLTGRSANLFLVDESNRILDTLRPLPEEGEQKIGDVYQAPAQHKESLRAAEDFQLPPGVVQKNGFASLSESLDVHYRELEAEQAFNERATAERAKMRREMEKRRKLLRNLHSDLQSHGDPEEHKRIGDLLFANIATAERAGNKVWIKDYYAEGEPSIEVEIDEHSTLQEEAARRFSSYARGKRATTEITVRIESIEREIATIEADRAELDRIVNERDIKALEDRVAEKPGKKAGAAGKGAGGQSSSRRKSSTEDDLKGIRRYLSTDGYEILVGRGARENDRLTFRVARPHDLWLHAADYPGAHVIVRNGARNRDVPHRTVIEAAQLAAASSQARSDTKVSVHYTQRKFLQKPKNAAPGLVRMSNYRTLLVEPRSDFERL